MLTETGKLIAKVDLPVRGHDVTYSPQAGRAVVFARRPGTFAVVFDPAGHGGAGDDRQRRGPALLRARRVLARRQAALRDRERLRATARGVIGIYDVAGGYARIGEFPTYGVGPHEMILLPDGKTFAIANGGIETHPDYGRARAQSRRRWIRRWASSMRATGIWSGSCGSPRDLHQLSIRHMVVDAQNRVWFGCQFRGDEPSAPQLVGYATLDGDIRLIELPPDALGGLRNYVGGLAISSDLETIAVSSPVGGTILCIDATSAQPVSTTLLQSTCGVATDGAGFLATNGLGEMLGLGGSAVSEQQFDVPVRRASAAAADLERSL